jgi:hypothetical protein
MSAGLFLLWVSLPSCLNSRFIQEAAQLPGLPPLSWDVRRIGPTGADIAGLQSGPAGFEAIRADVIQLDYAAPELYRRHLRRCRISGLEIYCGVKGGNFFIRGMDLKKILGTSESPTISHAGGSRVPSGRIEIHQGVVIMDWEGKPFRIPFDLDLSLTGSGPAPGFLGRLNLYPRGQTLSIGFTFYPEQNNINISFEAPSLDVNCFADLLARVPGLSLSGQVDVSGEAQITPSPFQVMSACVSIQWENPKMDFPGLSIRGIQAETGAPAPCRGEIQTLDGREWIGTLSSIRLSAPLPLEISRLSAAFTPSDPGIMFSGRMDFGLQSGETLQNFTIVTPLMLPAGFIGSLTPERGWGVDLVIPQRTGDGMSDGEKNTKTFEIQIKDTVIRSTAPEIKVSGHGKGDQGTMDYAVRLPDFQIKAGGAGIQTPGLTLSGHLRLDASDGGDVRIKADADKTQLNIREISVLAPELSLEGIVSPLMGGPMTFMGGLNISKGSVHLPNSKTSITGISAGIPLSYPWQGSQKKGKIALNAVKWDKWDAGRLEMSLRQTASGMAFQGNLHSSLLPDLKLDLKGEAGFMSENGQTRMDFESHYQTPRPLNLGDYARPAQGMTAEGRLKLKGGIGYSKAGLTGQARVSLEKGRVLSQKLNMALEDIGLDLNVTDLFHMRSAGAQSLTIGSISAGRISLNDARIEFQMESDRNIFVEKARFEWCGGRLNSQSLRIQPGLDTYDLILYCDRLNLSKVLEQLGGAQAEGEGTVNGQIPIRFKEGKFSFDDGFLYSTPGDGGTIHLKGTETLMQNLTPNTPQFFQLDLAREALKDYVYEWVKLRLITEGENLMMRISFDGKPQKPIPFIYNENTGSFTREVSGRLSHFQGIRLNVNLGLPLNQILQYKGVWDKISPD